MTSVMVQNLSKSEAVIRLICHGLSYNPNVTT